MLPLELTLEQQANLKIFQVQAQSLDIEEARELLLSLMQQLMLKNNCLRELMKDPL